MTQTALSLTTQLADGAKLISAGRLEEAERVFTAIVRAHPHSTAALNQLALLLERGNHFIKALSLLERSLALDAAQAEAQYHAGRLSRKLNHIGEAIAHFNAALKLNPAYLDSYMGLANCFMDQQMHEMGEKVLQMALRHHPDHPQLLSALVLSATERGEKDAATRLCQESLARHPDNALLFCQLAELEKLTAEDPLVVRAVKNYEAGIADPLGRANLAFMLGDVYARAGADAAAFRFYREANAARREEAPYAPKEQEADFERLKRIFCDDSGPKNPVAPSPVPVFIVGMPRSGTTLVEQVLASHPQLYGAGETDHMRVVAEISSFKLTHESYPENIAALDAAAPDSYTTLAEIYLAQLRIVSNGAPYVSDKMPHNFLRIGLIRRLFPGAKVIYCLRDGMDNGLSIYTRSFSGHHPYAYDMKSLGHYYRQHLELMDRWQRIFPGWIHTVRYEELVKDFEPNVRCLLDFCDLEWEPRCLEFHKTERVVQTLSVDQVRRPLYTSSIGKWRRYASYLAPLRAALGDAGNRGE